MELSSFSARTEVLDGAARGIATGIVGAGLFAAVLALIIWFRPRGLAPWGWMKIDAVGNKSIEEAE